MGFQPGNQIDHVLQDLHHGGSNQDTEDRSLSAPQTTSSQHRRCDGVELEEISVGTRLRRIAIQDEKHPPQSCQHRTDDVGENHHAVGVNPAQSRRFFVVAQGKQVASPNGLPQKDPGRDRKSD